MIEDVVRRLDDKLIAHNRTSVDFLSGPVEIRDSTYPLDAVQQLGRNAVMHRTYEGTNAPTHVYWFDDRIEIGSPGGAYGAVNAGNFGQPGVVDYRNPILAEAMRCSAWCNGTASGYRRRAGSCAPPDIPSRSSAWIRAGCTARCERALDAVAGDSYPPAVAGNG